MRRKRKHKNRLRKLLVLAAIVLLFVGAIAGVGWWIYSRLTAPREIAPNTIASPKTKEIMVMGVDPRANDTGRSDTLFIVSLDEEKKKASVLSIPRDTRVEMEQGAYEKINHAYAYGGHEYTKTMLERLLATRLDGYVLVDIHAFERMIDAIGGVDINVDRRMYYEDPWDEDGGLVIDLQPGEQHLDGLRAMQYVRFRDEEGDLGRIARQQKFLQAMLARAASPEVIPHLPQLVRELSSVIETDMETADMIRVVAMLPDVKGNGVVSEMLPGVPAWWQETSYWLPDIKAARTLFASQLGTSLTPEMEAQAVKDAAAYEAGLPKGLAEVNGTMRLASSEEVAAAKEKQAREERRKLRVRVLNESGIKGAAAASADVLRAQGFIIDDKDVGNGETRDRQQTVLIVPKGMETLFDELPFPCVVQTGDDDTAVLRIGKDYGNA